MADISQMNVNGTTYDIKDTVARASGVPSGGNTNQVLTKFASGYGWSDVSSGGGTNMIVYNENVITKNHAYSYELGRKLIELGFSGNDVALISAIPIYVNNPPISCRLYIGNVNQSYNRLKESVSGTVSIDAILTPQTIPDLQKLWLDFYFDGDNTNNAFLSIRIIKAPVG